MNVYWGDCWIDGEKYAVYCTEIKVTVVNKEVELNKKEKEHT